MQGDFSFESAMITIMIVNTFLTLGLAAAIAPFVCTRRKVYASVLALLEEEQGAWYVSSVIERELGRLFHHPSRYRDGAVSDGSNESDTSNSDEGDETDSEEEDEGDEGDETDGEGDETDGEGDETDGEGDETDSGNSEIDESEGRDNNGDASGSGSDSNDNIKAAKDFNALARSRQAWGAATHAVDKKRKWTLVNSCVSKIPSIIEKITPDEWCQFDLELLKQEPAHPEFVAQWRARTSYEAWRMTIAANLPPIWSTIKNALIKAQWNESVADASSKAITQWDETVTKVTSNAGLTEIFDKRPKKRVMFQKHMVQVAVPTTAAPVGVPTIVATPVIASVVPPIAVATSVRGAPVIADADAAAAAAAAAASASAAFAASTSAL
jgi:hypothetical protein